MEVTCATLSQHSAADDGLGGLKADTRHHRCSAHRQLQLWDLIFLFRAQSWDYVMGTSLFLLEACEKNVESAPPSVLKGGSRAALRGHVLGLLGASTREPERGCFLFPDRRCLWPNLGRMGEKETAAGVWSRARRRQNEQCLCCGSLWGCRMCVDSYQQCSWSFSGRLRNSSRADTVRRPRREEHAPFTKTPRG